MKVTRKKLVDLWALIQSITTSENRMSVKFQFILQKNKRLLATEIESMEEVNKTPPSNEERYTEYNVKRVKLCKEFCEKGENGEPILKYDNFIIPNEKKELFNKGMEPIKEEYKDVIENIAKHQIEINNLLEEEVDIDLTLIPLSEMPKELDGRAMDVLFDIIDEEL